MLRSFYVLHYADSYNEGFTLTFICRTIRKREQAYIQTHLRLIVLHHTNITMHQHWLRTCLLSAHWQKTINSSIVFRGNYCALKRAPAQTTNESIY